MRATIAVVGSEPLLATAVARACPAFTITPAVDDTTALIVADRRGAAEGTSDAVRVLVSDDAGSAAADAAQIVIPKSAFLAAPEAFLTLFEFLVNGRLERRRLEAELRASRDVEELLTIVDVDQVAARVTRNAVARLGLAHGTLLLYDRRTERVVSASRTPDAGSAEEFPHAVISRALPVALHEERGYKILHATADLPRPLLLIPILAGSDPVAVLVAATDAAAVDADRLEDAILYLKAVAVVLAHAIHLGRSIELTFRDDLTNAYNRRFFETCMNEEIERARRYNTLLSIIFLDLDDLKEVNNRFGHLAGSRTLQEVARRILGAVRGIDKVVRFGGDEFCVVLPQTDSEQAKTVANRIRRALEEREVAVEADVTVPITASFGIATFPVHAQSKEELIQQADQAMLSVKSTTKKAVGVADGTGTNPQVRWSGE